MIDELCDLLSTSRLPKRCALALRQRTGTESGLALIVQLWTRWLFVVHAKHLGLILISNTYYGVYRFEC